MKNIEGTIIAILAFGVAVASLVNMLFGLERVIFSASVLMVSLAIMGLAAKRIRI